MQLPLGIKKNYLFLICAFINHTNMLQGMEKINTLWDPELFNIFDSETEKNIIRNLEQLISDDQEDISQLTQPISNNTDGITRKKSHSLVLPYEIQKPEIIPQHWRELNQQYINTLECCLNKKELEVLELKQQFKKTRQDNEKEHASQQLKIYDLTQKLELQNGLLEISKQINNLTESQALSDVIEKLNAKSHLLKIRETEKVELMGTIKKLTEKNSNLLTRYEKFKTKYFILEEQKLEE